MVGTDWEAKGIVLSACLQWARNGAGVYLLAQNPYITGISFIYCPSKSIK